MTKKVIKQPRKQEKPLTKGGFLKALDKVISTVKKKSSVRGKKGTSG
jgi:hypothetical protein